MKDSYFTIKNKTYSELKISKSKFISQAVPFISQSEIPGIINSVKKEFYDASHHPYAYRVGPDDNNYRFSDDGEPQGSSGKPILEAIDKFQLTDIIVIVSRYFGGVKLGVGGLRRAMSEAAELCLAEAEITEKLITEILKLEFDYRFMNAVMNLAESEKIKVAENLSDEKCRLALDVRLSLVPVFKKRVLEITNGSAVFL